MCLLMNIKYIQVLMDAVIVEHTPPSIDYSVYFVACRCTY